MEIKIRLKETKNESMFKALDEGSVSRDSYRRLCAIESHLPREGAVSKEYDSEEADIDDEAIVQEVIDAKSYLLMIN
ncbi:hypothetical protein C1645_828071 [Glomus cerebriforme]|uniref:Uncharacterized protein n=1 Tax=Glomus cerebriforme TaxID=658196 RepID=A0A397STF9_9GLOM|nr:hypothetical protein C1645_828071 [Glomus cerebriforme]